MSGFPSFGGRRGEDPTEYIEDVELYVDERVGDGNNERKKRMEVSVFRRGLKGSAKDWYKNQPSDERRNFDGLKSDFQTHFPLRMRRHDAALASPIEASPIEASPIQASPIDNFQRRAGESLNSFIFRSTALAYRASEPQARTLRDRLYRYMCAGGHDEDAPIQARVTSLL